MARKNYSKFSKKSEDAEAVEEVVEEVVKESNETMNEVFNEVMEEIVEEKPVEEVVGIVVNCTKLNVRKKADVKSVSLGLINKGTEVDISLKQSTEDFYKVIVGKDSEKPVVGYCMKEFIKIK